RLSPCAKSQGPWLRPPSGAMDSATPLRFAQNDECSLRINAPTTVGRALSGSTPWAESSGIAAKVRTLASTRQYHRLQIGTGHHHGAVDGAVGACDQRQQIL